MAKKSAVLRDQKRAEMYKKYKAKTLSDVENDYLNVIDELSSKYKK